MGPSPLATVTPEAAELKGPSANGGENGGVKTSCVFGQLYLAYLAL